MIQPEGHPRDADDHESGDIDGDDVVAELAPELHVQGEAAVDPGVRCHVTLRIITQFKKPPLMKTFWTVRTMV